MILKGAVRKASEKLSALGLLDDQIKIRARVLSAQEAIGNPETYDFPLLKGKECIVEANFKGCLGHAFTDTYGGFEGTLKEVFEMPGTNNYRRALQVAAINAVCRFLGEIKDTVHCRDEEPKECAKESVVFLKEKFANVKKIAVIGLQPAFVDALSKAYELRVLDLDKENIGKEFFGQEILDGLKDSERAIGWADLVLATGSTLVNGSIDKILSLAKTKPVVFYGVTISGAAWLMKLNRLCFAKER